MSERIHPIEPEDLTPEQKEAYTHISKAAEQSFGDAFTYKTPSGAFIGPFAPLLATPSICKPFFDFMGAVSSLPGLPASARETAILAIGSQYQAPYEIYAHERVALKNTSLTKEQINAIKNGRKPEGLGREESVAFDVAVELAGGGTIGEGDVGGVGGVLREGGRVGVGANLWVLWLYLFAA